MLSVAFILTDLLVVLATLGVYKVLRSRSSLPLPPGPKAGFLGRSSLPASSDYPWKTYTKWREVYGDIIYAYVFGNPIVILNSREVTRDLLDKRSSIYSSRPVRTMVQELMSWGWLFSTMPYGDKWRKHRRMFNNHFHPIASTTYYPVQLKETHSLLRYLLETPKDFNQHIRRQSAAIVMMISYGYQISPNNDYYVSLADNAFMGLGKAGVFGSYLVDYIPALKHLPTWMPGAGFKRQARAWSQLAHAMIEEPFEMIKRQLAEGTANPSIAAAELEGLFHGKATYYDEEVVKDVSAISYAAGAETTVSAVLNFILAMAIYPDIQEKAQAEIDHFIGNARLPTFEDRDKLPYITGIVLECFRVHPVVPLGLARSTTKDDVFKGMRIPANTTVISNVWGILHDEALYPEPMKFIPDRFVGPSPPGVNEYPLESFGFGRRICPGRYLAEATVWITVASVLSVFNISKGIDGNGRTIEPDQEPTSGFLSRPKPFSCRFTPRSEAALKLIQETELN